jgi:hypothetical protein
MNLRAKRPELIRDVKSKQLHSRFPHPVHPALPTGDALCGSEWSPDRLRVRLETELRSEAFRRWESAARRRGGSVEEFFLGTLQEAS